MIAAALAILIAGSAPEWPAAAPRLVWGIPVAPGAGLDSEKLWHGRDDGGALDPDGPHETVPDDGDPGGGLDDAEDHTDEILEI